MSKESRDVRLMPEECWIQRRCIYKDGGVHSVYILTNVIQTRGTGGRHSREGGSVVKCTLSTHRDGFDFD